MTARSAMGIRRKVAASYRARAEAENLLIRELIIAVTSRPQFVGTPARVADEIDRCVQADACDGFILTPHGPDRFVDRVVPLLQERGAHSSRCRRALPAALGARVGAR